MAGLTKRGNRYYMTEWVSGKLQKTALHTGDPDEAREKIAEIMRQRELDKQQAEADSKDSYAKWRDVPLAEHLPDYRESLLAKQCSPRHVDMTIQRAGRVLEAGDLRFIVDVNEPDVRRTIKSLRRLPQSSRTKPEDQPRISNGCANGYLRCLQSFLNHLVAAKRIPNNPIAGMAKWSAKVDVRHGRRALTTDETPLLRAARASKITIEGMEGSEREDLYRFALLTGLRRDEIASLTPGSFTLTRKNPYLTVAAWASKHRETDHLPLHPELLELVRRRIAGRGADDPIFPGLRGRKTAKMIRADLKAAGIPYRDGQGRVADFHALRHTYITGAWASGRGRTWSGGWPGTSRWR